VRRKTKVHIRNRLYYLSQSYVFLALFLLLLSLGGCQGHDSHDQNGYIIEANLPISMRDGVVLRADLWRPVLGSTFPVLIFRTPYNKNEGDPDNERTFKAAVRRGYAVLVQDVRGRYASNGTYEPYRQEREDGYDTVEWAASQPWSDGRIGCSASPIQGVSNGWQPSQRRRT
jgi:predicted acyl esterase